MRRSIIWLAITTIALTACTAEPSAPPISASPSAPVLPTSQLVSVPENCKLIEDSKMRNTFDAYVSAFPGQSKMFPLTGTIKVALLPFDWADKPGKGNPADYIAKQVETFNNYYTMVSGGKISFDWVVPAEWFRLPGKSSDYKLSKEDESSNTATSMARRTKLLSSVVKSADPKVDFTGVQAVYLLAPQGPNNIEISAQGFETDGDKIITVKSDEAAITNWLVAGEQFTGNWKATIWSYWAHETGHFFYLPDLANFNARDEYSHSPMGGYDLMATQDGPTRTLDAWLRWVQGWLEDSQVTCIDESEITTDTFALAHLNSEATGAKVLIIKTSATTAVAVESRRYDERFDSPLKYSRDGLIIYSINSKKGHGEGALKLAEPRGLKHYIYEDESANSENLDATLFKGESVDFAGFTFKALELGDLDYVQITKAK